MITIESEELERQRRARNEKYGDDLRQQISDNSHRNWQQQPISNFQNVAANQILNLNNNNNYKIKNQSSFNDDIHSHINSKPFLSSNDTPQSARPQQQLPPLFSNNNTDFNAAVPALQQQINSIHHLVERIVSVEIPSQLKPNEDSIVRLDSKFESLNSSFNFNNQSMKDKLSELTVSFNSVYQKSVERCEKMEVSLNKLKSDVSHSNEILSSKMNQFDAKLEKIDASICALSNRQQQLEALLNEQSSILSSSILNVQQNSIVNDQQLQKQIECLNGQTINTFGIVNDTIKEATTALNESISSLAKDARDSFEIVRNEHDEDILALKSQIEQTSTEVNHSLSSLQSEVVQTFATFQKTQKENTSIFQNSIESEKNDRISNEKRLLEICNALSSSFSTQILKINNQLENIEGSIQPRVDKVCLTYFERWKDELAVFVKESVKSISECRIKMNSLDNKIIEINNKQLGNLDNADFEVLFNDLKDEFNEKMLKSEQRADVQIKSLRLSMKELNQFVSETALLTPRVEKLENKQSKYKQKIQLALDQNDQLIDITGNNGVRQFGENQRMPTERLDFLEKICGKRKIPPRLVRLEREILKLRKLIPNNLYGKIDRMINGFSGLGLLNERLSRLESLHNTHLPHVLPRSQSCGLIKLNSILPRPPLLDTVFDNEEEESSIFDSQDSKHNKDNSSKPKESSSYDDSYSNSSFNTEYFSTGMSEYYDNKKRLKPRFEAVEGSRFQLCFDVRHDDLRSKDPKPGIFILLIGEPKPLAVNKRRGGLQKVMPKKFDEFIYAKPESNEDEVKALLAKRKGARYQPLNTQQQNQKITEPSKTNENNGRKKHRKY